MDDYSLWTKISLTEFNARGHAYRTVNLFSIALEHWADRRGLLLGVVALDRIDGDYGYVVLSRDEHSRFRAIEVVGSHPSIEEARIALRSMMQEIFNTGTSMFPQDCLQ
jgi:hypothetical protein